MIIDYDGKKPIIDSSAFVAPNATIIGDVTIGSNSSIWYQTVLRGDMDSIKIGSYTNLQDFCMVHIDEFQNVEVGDYVTAGHRALIHGCKIGNNCLIGMGAIIMDKVEIGDNCIIGAGSLVTQGTKIPSGSMAFGSPAKVKRELTEEEISIIIETAKKYCEYAKKYV
jgi:carbonic anhydrase/acetyltransferase-like protein (isoleucine patch superfamily)